MAFAAINMAIKEMRQSQTLSPSSSPSPHILTIITGKNLPSTHTPSRTRCSREDSAEDVFARAIADIDALERQQQQRIEGDEGHEGEGGKGGDEGEKGEEGERGEEGEEGEKEWEVEAYRLSDEVQNVLIEDFYPPISSSTVPGNPGRLYINLSFSQTVGEEGIGGEGGEGGQ